VPIFDEDDPSHWVFPTPDEIKLIKEKLTQVGIEQQNAYGITHLDLSSSTDTQPSFPSTSNCVLPLRSSDAPESTLSTVDSFDFEPSTSLNPAPGQNETSEFSPFSLDDNITDDEFILSVLKSTGTSVGSSQNETTSDVSIKWKLVAW